MFENLRIPTALPGTVGALALVTVLSILPNESFAKIRDDARIRSFSFSASQLNPGQAINVISTNGERWNEIAPGRIELKIDMNMELRGTVISSGLFLGVCSKTGCGRNPLLRAKYGRPISPTGLDMSKIPVSRSGIAPIPYGDQMVKACNQYLTDGPREARGFTWPITVTLSVNTARARLGKAFTGIGDIEFYAGGDVSRQSTFRVKVNCVPYASMIRGADPVEVKLTVEPRPGKACPRSTKIKTRIVYNYNKTATFNILRNGKKIKTVKIKARKVSLSHGPTQWVINREDVVEAKAGQNRFRIKVKGGGQSQVQTANIECAPFEVLSAKLQYDVVGSASCPKKVWQTVTFTANGPGRLVYQLIRKFNGTVAVEKSLKPILKNGIYKLVGQQVLTINKSVDQEFRVQVKGQSGNNSAWARLKVDCPQKGNKGASGIKTAPKKTHAKQDKPRIKTAPLPKKSKRKLTKITCKKGKVRAGKCYCGVKRKQVRTGKRSYICKIKPGVRKVNPRKRKIGKRCGRRKVLVRGRCIRRAS